MALQLVYITKFFIWETGYFCTIDIMHDRAGYYICWGCLAWLLLHPKAALVNESQDQQESRRKS